MKVDKLSNPVNLSITPEVVATEVECSKCLGVMTITGQNFAVQPACTDEDINVTEGGRQLDIIEWTDTEIKAAGARCRGTVEVNALFGSEVQSR